MTQRKLKLTLWPTLFTIPALLVLVGLGTWQLQRMQWKSEIIDTFEERISDKAVAPPLKVTNIEKWRFKRVALMGKFMHQHEFAITGKTFEGTAGFHLVTPLQSTDGKITLINRGWIPERLRHKKTRPETLTEGSVVVEGIIREDKKRDILCQKTSRKMTFGSTSMQSKWPPKVGWVRYQIITLMCCEGLDPTLSQSELVNQLTCGMNTFNTHLHGTCSQYHC